MNATPGADGPEDVDATFERIVADLKAEGVGATSETAGRDVGDDNDDNPEEEGQAGDRRGSPRRRPRSSRDTSSDADADARSGTGWRESDTGWDGTIFGDDPAEDDEHFVPPEPPPLPRPRKGAFVVLLFFVLGIVLLTAPGLLGLSGSIGLPLGLLALTTGIALLLLRVRQGPPDGADPGNGAQV